MSIKRKLMIIKTKYLLGKFWNNFPIKSYLTLHNNGEFFTSFLFTINSLRKRLTLRQNSLKKPHVLSHFTFYIKTADLLIVSQTYNNKPRTSIDF